MPGPTSKPLPAATLSGRASLAIRHTHEHPDYIAADRKLQDIRLRKAEVDRAIQCECTRRADFRRSTMDEAKAHALVHGDEVPPEVVPVDLAKLEEELRVLGIAEEVAHRNRVDVESRISREIIARVMPEYAELIRRQHEAALPFIAALEAEVRFIDDLTDGGVQLGELQRVLFMAPDRARNILDYEVVRRAREFHGLTLGGPA